MSNHIKVLFLKVVGSANGKDLERTAQESGQSFFELCRFFLLHVSWTLETRDAVWRSEASIRAHTTRIHSLKLRPGVEAFIF